MLKASLALAGHGTRTARDVSAEREQLLWPSEFLEGGEGGRDLSSVGLHAAVEKLDCDKGEPLLVRVSLIDGPHDAFCELLPGLLLRK